RDFPANSVRLPALAPVTSLGHGFVTAQNTLLLQKEVSSKDHREQCNEHNELSNRLWRCGHRYQKKSDDRCDVYVSFIVGFHTCVVCLCSVSSGPNYYNYAEVTCAYTGKFSCGVLST